VVQVNLAIRDTALVTMSRLAGSSTTISTRCVVDLCVKRMENRVQAVIPPNAAGVRIENQDFLEYPLPLPSRIQLRSDVVRATNSPEDHDQDG
jgi:hypothetical protein